MWLIRIVQSEWINHGQPSNDSLSKETESFQYSIALAKAEAITCTSREKFYQDNWLLQKFFFLPSVINERNKPDPYIRNSSSEAIFWNALLKFLRPVASKTYSINDSRGLKFLTRVCVGLSH